MIDYPGLGPDGLAREAQVHVDEVIRDFAPLDHRQLNWTAHPKRWSVAQCLHHLVGLDRRYLERLAASVARTRARGRMSNGPYPGTAFGRWFVKQVGPQVKLQLRPPGPFAPAQTDGVADDITDRFVRNGRDLIAFLDLARGVDLQAARIGSPIAPIIRFTAIDAVRTVVAHQRRHLDQARRVMQHPEFPPRAMA